MTAPLSRRSALKLLSANVALIAAGCGRPPDNVLPYVRMPERLAGSVPLRFATILPLGAYGRGVIATSVEGRPIKISGNPDHAASRGATDVFAEAQVLSLYDPDRSQACRGGINVASWDQVMGALNTRLDAARAKAGRGVALLTGPTTSPTLVRQIDDLRKVLPGLRWYVHDPLADAAAENGARLAFGRDLVALPRFADADVVVTLDADPLGPGPAQIVHAQGFSDKRRVRVGSTHMSRLYAFESGGTITGAKADVRRTLHPAQIRAVAVSLARALGAPLAEEPLPPGLDAILPRLIADLRAARGRALVLVGASQPAEIHALVHWINHAIAAPLQIIEPVAATGDGTLATFVDDAGSGAIDTLLISGCNPGYDAPADLAFEAALAHVPFKLHHGLYRDETAALCTWHAPSDHPLENWTDLRAPDGTAGIGQPLIERLYDTRSLTNLLASMNGQDASDFDLLRETWRPNAGTHHFDAFWRDVLRTGVVADSVAKGLTLPPPTLPPLPTPQQAPGLSLMLRPDPCVYDGSFANNAWLQECPKPLTTEVWGNAAALSPADAQRFGVADGGSLEISADGRSVVAAVRIDDAQADGVVALTLGYGRRLAGAIGDGVGVNAFALRHSASPWRVDGIAVKRRDDGPTLSSTQKMFEIDADREDIFPEFHLGDRRLSEEREPADSLLPPPDSAGADARWAMVIDSTACIGCNACVVACQVENNVPVIGPAEIARNRDMHWLRIDTYKLANADGRLGFQPVPCMHCEEAPCEPVCPVGASMHDSEGLNVQVYNRCIGTRFCEANCPYKVRRFNFFGYADGQEYGNLGHAVMHAHNNPDVSVRARGVMEKCTYCVQRLSGARRSAEKDNRPLRETDVTTACQDACPTRAITFGNLNDPDSRLPALRQEPQHFTLLGKLDTKPRTTYLADIRNPPDATPATKGAAP